MKSYKLPNGKITHSLNYYLRSWKKLANPIIKKTGWQLIGFDPGFLFSTGKYDCLSLTVAQIKDLLK